MRKDQGIQKFEVSTSEALFPCGEDSSPAIGAMAEDSVSRDRLDRIRRKDENHDRPKIARESTESSSSPSSSFTLSYSVNSQSEYGFTQRSIAKSGKKLTYVQQLTMKFENLSTSDESMKNSPKFSVGIFPWTTNLKTRSKQITEVPSEDEVDDISECEEVTEQSDDMQPIEPPQSPKSSVPDILIDEYDDVFTETENTSDPYQDEVKSSLMGVRLSEAPKSIIEARNLHVRLLSCSTLPHRKGKENDGSNDHNHSKKSKQRRNTCEVDVNLSQLSVISNDQKDIPPIIEELVKTEESYVHNLKIGIKNYGSIFDLADIPDGLRGKKFLVLGNIEQILEFHETEFLPMLQQNFADTKKLFDEFAKFIDSNCFYMYIIYTMNKKNSLKLCETHKEYFKTVQDDINDKLGINSFLVQPIQRLARYPLILQQFITTCFKSGDIKHKPAIESCCKVEKRLRNLLTVTNESEELNDIEECHDVEIFYQGKFKKSNEFNVYDYTQRRTYKAKAFIFDKSLIYAEMRDKRLVFRGCYPSEHVGFIAKHKSFTLYYQKRKIQECDFSAEQNIIDHWVELIREMITMFAMEEKRKLKEKYSRNSDIYRMPESVTLFRNTSRISSDSGFGSICSAPLAPMEESNPRTTWSSR